MNHFRTQINFEDCLMNYAMKTNADCVILCDRGLMDGSAYVSPDTWQSVLAVRTEDNAALYPN